MASVCHLMLDLMRKEANGYCCLWRDKEKNRKSQREAPTLEILDCCAEFDCVRMCDGCFRRMHSVLNFPAVEICFPFFPFPSWCFVSCVSCTEFRVAFKKSLQSLQRFKVSEAKKGCHRCHLHGSSRSSISSSGSATSYVKSRLSRTIFQAWWLLR